MAPSLLSTETIIEDSHDGPFGEQLEIEENQRLDLLQADIHPLFAYKRWFGLSKAEYIQLAPAMRLASRLLTSDRALMFWHAFLVGPRQSKSATDGVDYHSFHRPYKSPNALLPAEIRRELLEILDGLAEEVWFYMAELPGMAGSCQILKDEEVPTSYTPKRPLEGVRSVIWMDENCFYDLFQQSGVDNAAYKRNCIEFADIAIHEIAHAISLAKRGDQPEEFFEDNVFTELGHAISNWLWEGEIVRNPKNPEALLVEKIPHRGLAERYREAGCVYPLSVEVSELPNRQVKSISDHDIDTLMGPWYGSSPPVFISSWRFTTGPLHLDSGLRRARKRAERHKFMARNGLEDHTHTGFVANARQSIVEDCGEATR